MTLHGNIGIMHSAHAPMQVGTYHNATVSDSVNVFTYLRNNFKTIEFTSAKTECILTEFLLRIGPGLKM